MRVLFTGGGTGGHVYPGLAVLERLSADRCAGPVQVAWVGRPAGVEEALVARQGIAFLPVHTGALRGRSPVQAACSLVNLARGIGESRQIVNTFRPEVVFSTGGYVTAPLTVAAWRSKVPVVIYLPDMQPGLAVRQLSHLATRVCVSFDSVQQHFTREVTVTGYPVRRELLTADKRAARKALGLGASTPVLLVLGGSSGAHSLNEAVSRHLAELLDLAAIVHVSGGADLAALEARADGLGTDCRSRYHLFGYLHEEMVSALAAADLVVARAGASTLAEFPAVGLPAILVPYPHAGQHQRVNAEYLAGRGAAIIVDDAQLGDRLVDEIRGLFTNPQRLHAMSQAMRAISVPDAADRLADVLIELAQGARRE